jgi:hypothetical protein
MKDVTDAIDPVKKDGFFNLFFYDKKGFEV